ncbi:transmembrane signal receptor [Lithospermum erythrorhizon]|uniref:non-specific serine/threonine protein kinase n=1 Tax=Lithospermum erythrorhizon TaxID=34254 RepID=A0AAV3PXU8_LITER
MEKKTFFKTTSHISIIFLTFFLPMATSNDDQQLNTLLTIKTSLNSPNTHVFDNWISSNSVCKFTGILCDINNMVLEIELSNKNLTGSVPFSSICELKSLEKLSLGKNMLHGEISSDLSKCVGLKYLDLGNNFFSGEIPSLSSMKNLTHLYMNCSGFSGIIPWNSLESLTGLVVLSIGDNPFHQTPFPEAVSRLLNLNWLYLTNCSIGGEIPRWIGNLTELINLEIAMNYLSGEIPVEITKLRKLWQLELYQNDLTGKLPVGLRNLTNLEYFDASSNKLYGDLSEIRFLNNLVSLQLLENEFTGEIPQELGDFKKLVDFSLYQNKLTGPLPQRLGSWAEFDFIDVSENFLTGPIPPDMCRKGTMTKLLMLQNNFTGTIPESYANCKTLIRFRVSKNQLSGVVPSGIWGLPNVDIIDIESNDLEGPISADISNAKVVKQLYLANNKLSGEIPSEISKAEALSLIDLSDNQFSGKLPSSIGELKKLSNIHLDGNQLSGSIPESLGSCDSLNDLSMAFNSLSGPIPASLGSLKNLNFLNLSNNKLSGRIPESLSSLKLNLIDLSDNDLSGLIPASLSVMASNGSFSGNDDLCSHTLKNFKQCSSAKSGMSSDLRTLIVCVLIGSIAMLVSLALFIYSKRSSKEHEKSWKENSWDVKSFHVLTFTEEEILAAIDQDNVIGKGGSGNVYKVSLENGLDLAVKHIWHNDSCGGEKKSSTPMLAKGGQKLKEFDAEVHALSSIRHINVVKLYCSISSEDSSLLVYEYMPNGSLWDRLHMFKKMELDWSTRYAIALGSAKGLEYLHHGCERPIIHRDVKSSNILLDELFKPTIADFGLAKITQTNSTKDSTHVIAGTHGYIAPEYGYTNKINEKSDVYSFGVVLMELVTGKRPIEQEFGEKKDIVEWVSSKLKTKESVLSLVDSAIAEHFKEDAIKVLRIAILCTSTLPAVRPMMRNVVKMLEEAEPCKLVGIVIAKDGDKKDKLQEHKL